MNRSKNFQPLGRAGYGAQSSSRGGGQRRGSTRPLPIGPVRPLLSSEPFEPPPGPPGRYGTRYDMFDHQRFEGYGDTWDQHQDGYDEGQGYHQEGYGGDDYGEAEVDYSQGYAEEGDGTEAYEEVEEEMPETIVAPKPTDRPRECAVCQRYVAQPASHGNARHLPWFVNPTSACCICGQQFNNKFRLDNHAATEHPSQVTAMPPKQWVICMKQLFKMLADNLEIHPEDIPQFVRENGLANKAQGSFTEEDQMYFDEPSFMGQRSYNTMNPICLRDCTHWQIVLRLIACAGEVHPALIRSSNPEEGYIFCPLPGEVMQPPAELEEVMGQISEQPVPEAPAPVKLKKKKKKKPVQPEEAAAERSGPAVFSVAEMLSNIKEGTFEAETVKVEVPIIPVSKKQPHPRQLSAPAGVSQPAWNNGNMQPRMSRPTATKRTTGPGVDPQQDGNWQSGPPRKTMRPMAPAYGRGRPMGVAGPSMASTRHAVVEDRHYDFGNATEEFRRWANQGTRRIASAFDAVIMKDIHPPREEMPQDHLIVPKFPEKTKYSAVRQRQVRPRNATTPIQPPEETATYSNYQQPQEMPASNRPRPNAQTIQGEVESYVRNIRQESSVAPDPSAYNPVTSHTVASQQQPDYANQQSAVKDKAHQQQYVYTGTSRQRDSQRPDVYANQPGIQVHVAAGQQHEAYNRQQVPSHQQPYVYTNRQPAPRQSEHQPAFYTNQQRAGAQIPAHQQQGPPTSHQTKQPMAAHNQANQPMAAHNQANQPIATHNQANQPMAAHNQANQPMAAHNQANQPMAAHNQANQPMAAHNQANQPMASHNQANQPMAAHNQANQPMAAHNQANQPMAAHNQANQPMAAHNQASQPMAAHNQASQPMAAHNQANVGKQTADTGATKSGSAEEVEAPKKTFEIPEALQQQLLTLTQGMSALSDVVMQLSKK